MIRLTPTSTRANSLFPYSTLFRSIGNDPPIFDILTICGRQALADAPVKEKQVKLQVANARAEESGGGIARIPRSAMAELGVTEGDVIQISGKRETASRVMAPYAEDEGLEVIRLDGLQRANAGAGAGDLGILSRSETRHATRTEEHAAE